MPRYPWEEEGERFLRSKVGFNQLLDDLHDLAGEITQCFVRTVKQTDLGPYLVIRGLFRKGINLIHSIEILVLHGYAYEAAILCRTLLETLTHVRYLLKEDAQIHDRAGEYIAYVLTRGAGIIKKVEENPKLDDFLSQEVREDIKQHAERARKQFDVPPEKLRKPFGLQTFEDEMDAAGLSIHYDVTYKYLSEYVHAQDVFSHVVVKEKEKEIESPLRAPDHIFELVLNTAVGAFIVLMEEVDQFLKCGRGELIKKCNDSWAKVARTKGLGTEKRAESN